VLLCGLWGQPTALLDPNPPSPPMKILKLIITGATHVHAADGNGGAARHLLQVNRGWEWGREFGVGAGVGGGGGDGVGVGESNRWGVEHAQGAQHTAIDPLNTPSLTKPHPTSNLNPNPNPKLNPNPNPKSKAHGG